jgi:F-type H+-transporting ATPase subunit b
MSLLILLPEWLDYPGLEAWKFLNLIVLIVLLYFVLRRPLSEAFRGRRERIKRELAAARAERDAALAKLAEIEARMSNLEPEIAAVEERARIEAEAERKRIANETEQEIGRIREQARKEIEAAGKIARHQLRRFAADESVRLAEEILRAEIRAQDDERLSGLSIQRLGRKSA